MPNDDQAVAKPTPLTLFPAFEKFVQESDTLLRAKGILSARLPRILGQGQTKASPLNLPPAPIERKAELLQLKLPDDVTLPADVSDEIERVRAEYEREMAVLRNADGARRLATLALKGLKAVTGFKNNNFYAGRLVLVSSARNLEWSWSITPHYSIIDKVPPDIEYLQAAYYAAESLIESLLSDPSAFERRLDLAWTMARHFSTTDDVLVLDVARMFKVANQGDRFWNSPQRSFFTDMPEAAFVANLIHWRRSRSGAQQRYDFVPATLHQAHGPKARVFYMPVNPEGTEVRPIAYIRRRGGQGE
jgi:hypothetical protein